jgi:eukaryotic-like serine/threonine-protein kinase
MVLAGNLLAGRYQLHEPIGAGWFSEVWRATDVALSRPVAVKLLHPAYAQETEAVARFRAEALNAAALWHENIAHIYDYDESATGPGAQPYLVMELVDGPSLAGVLVGGSLDAARTMDVVAQAAAGLQAAHTTGLIHGDIKPENLLLASSGTVKITDWGLSHAVDSAPATAAEMRTGTAAYLAPERIAGAQGTPASDLYALGVVAYECLAGAPPFVGELPDLAYAHRDHSVPPLAGSVPGDVSALVMKLVARDPAWRPGSAAEVVQQAGRLRNDLRHELRDDLSVDAGRTPYSLAAAAAVPPPPPAIAPAAVADDARRQVPAAPRPDSRARPDARRLRRRPVLVLACLAVAALIGMALAVTVGVAPVQHLAAAPPSTPPGRSISGIAAGPPARQPSSAAPSRGARAATSPGDMGAVPVVVSDHRTGTGSASGRDRIRRHRHGNNHGHGDHGHSHSHSHGEGNRDVNGTGHGHGHGNGQGNGQGHGNGQRNGNGQGHGNGQRNGNGPGHGNGNAQVLSISSQVPDPVTNQVTTTPGGISVPGTATPPCYAQSPSPRISGPPASDCPP